MLPLSTASTGHRLLVLGDGPAVGDIVARVAESVGYTTLVVEQAEAFLEHARTWAPTHIAMDMQMPVVDGLQLLSHLASDRCQASIILISDAGDGLVNAARRVGNARGLNVAAALAKPIKTADLAAVLRDSRAEDPWLTLASVAEAMERQEFFLLYQPKIDLQAGRVTGVEALVRWRHPERGVIAPREFIPFAESSACIDQLTQWIGATACAEARAWDAAGCRLDLAVNVSVRNLHDAELADQLEAHCLQAGLNPSRVTLELTETSAMRDAGQMLDVLTRLRLKGFRLAIDDFGSGYSSLVQLHRLPFNEIKVDREFVSNCATSAESRSIVRLVVELAHALRMHAVAEGVESAKTLQLLREMGCNEAQGAFIAPALAAQDVPHAVATAPNSVWYRAGGPWVPAAPSGR